MKKYFSIIAGIVLTALTSGCCCDGCNWGCCNPCRQSCNCGSAAPAVGAYSSSPISAAPTYYGSQVAAVPLESLPTY